MSNEEKARREHSESVNDSLKEKSESSDLLEGPSASDLENPGHIPSDSGSGDDGDE